MLFTLCQTEIELCWKLKPQLKPFRFEEIFAMLFLELALCAFRIDNKLCILEAD
jgi:hypothetical protein